MLKLTERLIRTSTIASIAQGEIEGTTWQLKMSQDQCIQVEIGGLRGRTLVLPIHDLVQEAHRMMQQAGLALHGVALDPSDGDPTFQELVQECPPGAWLPGQLEIQGRPVDALLCSTGEPVCTTRDEEVARLLSHCHAHTMRVAEELKSDLTMEACGDLLNGEPLTMEQRALVGRVVLASVEMVG